MVGAVSPPGGDFSEPVTQHTTRFTRCFWALDRDLAYSRHYPAVGWLNSYSEYLGDVRGWWERYCPDWFSEREEMMNILSEEDELQQIVKLVGPDVLPDGQRLVLLTADMFKTGFLQQSALDEVDRYCPPEKQVRLLEAFVGFFRRARQAIQAGTPIGVIREMEIVQVLRRAKSTVPNDDDAAIRDLFGRLDAEFTKLESP